MPEPTLPGVLVPAERVPEVATRDEAPAVRHVFVTPDYPPDLGGMARRYAELVRRYPEPMSVSTVAAPGAAEFDAGELYPIDRQPFGFARSRVIYSQLRWGRALARPARRWPTVLHCGAIRAAGYAVWVANRATHAPYVLYVNGQDLLSETRKVRHPVKRLGGAAIFARAAGVVANSPWTADLARSVMASLGVRRPPPVAAIDLGTDPEQFHPARDTGALRRRFGIGGAPLLVTVARLVRHKGQDVALAALARLRSSHPDLRYLIVGTGYDEERLRALAGDLGVGDAVHFAGPLADAEVAEAYAAADLYVGLSRTDGPTSVEGFGLSFVEAAASGTPAVAGDSGGVRAAVRDGETGPVVPPTDAAAAAAAIARVIDDAALRAALGARARALVETHYNWQRVADETAAFVHRVTRAPARAVPR